MRFWTSDQHFYHKSINSLCNRPFESLDEMHYQIIERWNSVIGAEDIVYCLGDFHWSPSHLKEIMDLLNGRKLLCAGNHDKCHSCHKKHEKQKYHYLQAGFEQVEESFFTSLYGYRIKMSHFPYWDPKATEGGYSLRYQQWRPEKDAEHVLLHGHRHSKPEESVRLDGEKLTIDVGVDAWNFTPLSENDIMNIIEENL